MLKFIQDYDKAINNIIKFSKGYLKKYDKKSVILGVSGGIDSALGLLL